MSESPTNRTGKRETTDREDRLDILRMLESGTISAEDAAQLLEALDRTERPVVADDFATVPLQRRGHHVRIQVDDGDHTKVNLTIPAELIDAGIAIVRKVSPTRLGDLEAIRQAVRSGVVGPVLEIHGEDGQHVSIVVE